MGKRARRDESPREEPRDDPRLLVLRLLAAFALGASLLLLYEHSQPGPTFCSEAGGCDLVRQSKWSKIAGVSTPLWGIAAFAGLLGLSFVRRATKALSAATFVVAAGAIGFIYLQAVTIKAWCVYCMFADVSALGMAVIGVLLLRAPPDEARRTGPTATALAIVLGLGAPFLFGLAVKPAPPATVPEKPVIVTPEELPEPIAREQRPGQAAIVEWLDFECPACRKQHERFNEILPQYGERVRLVRKMLPLPMHEHAPDAARAWCCAEEKGLGDDMANLLMSSEEPTKEACEGMAQKLGMDLAEYRECVASERITKRLEQERQEAISVGVRALPTYYIGRERFEGGREDDVIRSSIERAITESQGS